MSLDVGAYDFRGPAATGQDVILGVRPENLMLQHDGAWEAKVSLIEPMGNHHVVWLDFGGTSLSSIVSGALSVAVDQNVRFSVDVSRITLFNRTTEQRL